MSPLRWAAVVLGSTMLALSWIGGWMTDDFTSPAIGTAIGLLTGLGLNYLIERSRQGAR